MRKKKQAPELSEFYRRKLLIPGWAGDLSPEELAFIKDALKKDRRLRSKWAMGRRHGRVNDNKIRKVAMFGVDGLQKMPSEGLVGSVQLRVSDDADSR